MTAGERGTPADAARHAPLSLAGAPHVLLAEALAVPVGLLVAAFLTRRLGPEGFGLFAVAAAVAAWIEWTVAAAYSRSGIKLVGEERDWRPVGAALVLLAAALGFGAGAALFLLAGPIGRAFGDPALAGHLRLFAIEVPLFALVAAHRNILVGLGRFRQRALAAAVRLLARLVLVVLLVQLGLSVTGAILGGIAATAAELAVCRAFVRPALLRRPPYPLRRLLAAGLALFGFSVCTSLLSRVDLLALKGFGATTAEAGVYAAAQTVSLLPGLLALVFSPLLLSVLSRALRDGREAEAQALARDALRAVLWLAPLAAAVVASADEVVRFVFGDPFAEAAVPLALLLAAGGALLLFSVSTAALTAAGRATWTFAVAASVLALAVAGHSVAVPRFGGVGAAAVTAGAATAAAVSALVLLRRAWAVSLPVATTARAAALATLVGALAWLWPAPGALVLGKLGVLTLFVAAALVVLREIPAAAVRRALEGGA